MYPFVGLGGAAHVVTTPADTDAKSETDGSTRACSLGYAATIY